jgi:putative transposase
VPARVPAEVKERVLKTVDDAVAAGFNHTWGRVGCGGSPTSGCTAGGHAADTGTLVDKAPGGHPVHTLLPDEVAAVLDVAERWGKTDRSHRKLAHRGSYQNLVWVSPATFRRVLVEHDLAPPLPRPACIGRVSGSGGAGIVSNCPRAWRLSPASC